MSSAHKFSGQPLGFASRCREMAALIAFGAISGVTLSARAAGPATDECRRLDPTYRIYSSRNMVTRRINPFSFGAAAVMGIQGFDRYGIPLPSEAGLLADCRSRTRAASLWPQSCEPLPMASAMNAASAASGKPQQYWAVAAFPGSMGIADAQAWIVKSLSRWSSPALIPLRGTASEWGVVDKACAQLDAMGNLMDFGALQYHDIQNNSTVDLIYSDFQMASLYKLMTKINAACDPRCTAAPYWNSYVVMAEPPPVGSSLLGSMDSALPLVPQRPKGIVQPGHTMTAELAQSQVWQAVDQAKFVGGPAVTEARHTGAPAPAFLVHGIGLEGESFEYFITPIRARQGSGDVLTFVSLAAQDGSVQALYTPDKPEMWHPLEEDQARAVASRLLHSGERLQPARLTFDLRVLHDSVRAPYRPFYEFPVVDSSGGGRDVVRVTMQSGELLGRSAAK